MGTIMNGRDLPGQIWSRVNVRVDRNQGVRVMPKKRYTPEEIIQHLRTVELDTDKGLAVLDSCRKLGITEQDARSASQRGTVLHAERSPDHHRTLENSLQHGPSAQQSRGPATRSRNYPACELRTNMVGGTKTPGWSVEAEDGDIAIA